jgi:hypothetical protein
MHPDVPLEHTKPVTMLIWHHTPVIPLHKSQNPPVFHLHLTIIEYIRIGKQMTMFNVVFVAASN